MRRVHVVYFADGSRHLRENILDVLRMSKRSLLFRYLGMTLPTKKLTTSECKGLLMNHYY